MRPRQAVGFKIESVLFETRLALRRDLISVELYMRASKASANSLVVALPP